MLEIDGSDGGGQLLRSSLALAAITERPVKVTGIRGDRPDPGLKAQHLAATRAIAEACNGTLEGATHGSEELQFQPGTPGGGHVEVSIDTAGTVTLLFDTVLPLAVALEKPLLVTATGGTDVKWSPPLSTYRHAKLPLCRRFGLQAAIDRHRTGFYPAGGGKATLSLGPSSLSELSLTERGECLGARIYSRESRDLTDSDVASRQAETARKGLEDAEIDVLEETRSTAETDSAGSVVSVVLEYESSRAGFDALGEPGKPAEQVADDALDPALDFHEGDAIVDRHLADQLLVFLALEGGKIHITESTAHVESSLALLGQFGFEVGLDSGDKTVLSGSGHANL